MILSSTQVGEITVYGVTETSWHISRLGLYVEKHKHNYRPRETVPKTT